MQEFAHAGIQDYRFNAISGVILIGALSVAAEATLGSPAMWLAMGAVSLAMVNVVGGFLVTDRMLGMIKKRERR